MKPNRVLHTFEVEYLKLTEKEDNNWVTVMFFKASGSFLPELLQCFIIYGSDEWLASA